MLTFTATRRLSPVLVLALSALVGPAARAASNTSEARLQANVEPGSLARVEILFEADGDLRVVDDGREQTLPMKVVGTLGYDERRQSALGDSSLRGWRYYDVAKATIAINKRTTQPELAEDHRLIGVEAASELTTLSSPGGPLTGEELDLVTVPGNTLAVDRLLPAEAVSQGSTWQQADDTWAMLLGLDAVSSNDVELKLVELTAEAAKIHLGGLVFGAVDGVATELEIKGKIKFDRQAGRITWLALLVKEKHGIGHTVPGLEALARVQIKITPQTSSKHLSDESLASLEGYWDQPVGRLVYHPASKAVQFEYDRRWHIVHEDRNGAVLRFVDRGELIAQCNVTAMPRASDGRAPSLSQFQDDIKTVLKEKFGQFVQATELESKSGGKLYRVLVTGTVAELPIQWNYHLVCDAAGRQAAVVVTLEQQLVDRLGDTDREIVESLILGDRPIDTAAQAPAPSKR